MPKKENKLSDLPIEERFKAGAEPRIKIAIRYIRMVKKMTKSPMYKPTEEEVTTLVNKLHEEVDSVLEFYKSAKVNTKEIEDIF